MKKTIKNLFLPIICALISISFTSAFFTDNAPVPNNTFSSGTASNTDIIINEFVPDPVGGDDAPMPNGEWIELYNKGKWTINVDGWVLDAGGVGIQISSLITDTGNTSIAPGGYLVVYGNGSPGIVLVNTGDTVNLRLFSGGVVIDTYTYTSIGEGKSWARVPNAGSSWVITDPTKGDPNV